MQDGEPHPINRPLSPAPRRVPTHASLRHRGEPVIVGAITERLARLHHDANIKLVDQGGSTAHVVTMRVRQDQRLEPPDLLLRQQRQQHLVTGVATPRIDRPGVHREPVSPWCPDQGRVALANIGEK